MSRTIHIKKQREWMFWVSLGWTRIFLVLASALLIVYFILLFQVNTFASDIQNIEISTRSIQRDTTDTQTKIYTITRDITFTDLASISELQLTEPRDLAILYMQLPEHTLVMR